MLKAPGFGRSAGMIGSVMGSSLSCRGEGGSGADREVAPVHRGWHGDAELAEDRRCDVAHVGLPVGELVPATPDQRVVAGVRAGQRAVEDPVTAGPGPAYLDVRRGDHDQVRSGTGTRPL